MNNAQMFIEKQYIVDILKKVIEKNSHIVAMVVGACQTIPEFKIPEDVPVDAIIWTLAADMLEA